MAYVHLEFFGGAGFDAAVGWRGGAIGYHAVLVKLFPTEVLYDLTGESTAGLAGLRAAFARRTGIVADSG